MKRASDAALRAYARLQHADFAALVAHLRESSAEHCKTLKRARESYDVAFSQGQIDILETILQFIEEGENLLFNRNHKL
ncbi:hypothetical protein [Paraburkholderia sp. BL10I2N1]|uniref:hypothetical protein n=1 Tax=Paraburkholderia sp. BL10I2N1 TaxID=1938796 RepID=UPI00105C9C82|nr:hypothetical protein [Paraburkholderia sp. BL10I2N1]TDN70417.1 hypothetical protein B0G77_3891 [Paraburkholderia sp. BL10I2N1]